MGLFSNKKDEADLKQTSEVKDATGTDTSLPTMGSTANLNVSSPPNMEEMPTVNSNNVPKNDFNNPFSNDVPKQDAMMNTSNGNNQLLSEKDFSDLPGNSTPSPMNLQMPMGTSGQNSAPSQNPMVPNNTMDSNISVPAPPNRDGGISREEIEEMINETVEKVIEERWGDIVAKIEKVVSWKEKQEAHVNMIKEDIVSLKDAFENLEKKMITKIGDYDRNILDVNSELKALEKVFQKITPTLVNNINELSKITRELKGDRDEPSDI